MLRRKRQPDEDRPPQDHSFRCSIHALNYPNPGKCAVLGCSEQLAPISNAPPTADLAYHIALLSGEELPYEERAEGWRVEQLVRAGAPMDLAERIAEDRSIDLHRAVSVVSAAGPTLAEAILL